MTLHSNITHEVYESPRGEKIGAFFDFDGTVIHGYSAFAFIKEQLLRGDIKPTELIELSAAMTSFGLGSIGFSAMMSATSQFMKGMNEEEYIAFGESVYQKHIAKLVYPESRALIEAHLKQGHTVALISAATPYQLKAAARDLHIKHVLCTQYEVRDGHFTGNLVRPTCYGQGKVTAAKSLVEQFDIDIEQSYFYSDSHEDIQLLKFVGNPRPLNPNKKLQQIARDNHWPCRHFDSRGGNNFIDYVRAVAAQGSLITSFLASLPIYALTGSKDKAVNFAISLFADTAAAIVGMDLEVEGSQYLWSHRPAVFIFNHQSKADVMVLANLLRRDIAGIGKQEIKKNPLLGAVMEFGGTVFIDRKNSQSAIEAMQPLVDVMIHQQKSVCIAPEGTRTVSPNLMRFKKGAFHLAMQAKVPIIPIVIHNSLDVLPKGEFVFKAAIVKVDVLAPVSTTRWTEKTLDKNIEKIRDKFLKTLGLMDLQNPEHTEPIDPVLASPKVK